LIGKKFTKFYLNDFTPITRLEEADVARARNQYRAFTMGSAILFGFMGYRWRRIKFGTMKPEDAPRDYNMGSKLLNDLVLVLVGYFCGHIFSCDYTYKHRQHILQRLYFEKNYPDFDRKALKQHQGIIDEYPFHAFPWTEEKDDIISDKYIIDDRINPVEVRQNAEHM